MIEEKLQLVSISIPQILVKIELVGTNSMIGSLCKKLHDDNYLNDIRVVKPDQILFIIKRIHKDVDIYEEINKVKNLMGIEENKINVFIEN